MPLDYEALDFWLKFANLAATAGIGIYLWLSRRHAVTNERITTLESSAMAKIGKVEDSLGAQLVGMERDIDGRLDDHATRLARLEQDQRHAPTHDDLKRIHARLDDAAREIANISGQFDGASRTLALIHDHLMNKRST